MANLRMLSTACGPEFCLDAGKTYTGVPAELAKRLCERVPATMAEEYEENGKKMTRSKVVGQLGPYAVEATGDELKNAKRFVRRDPNARVES